jgi:hypothetical protein
MSATMMRAIARERDMGFLSVVRQDWRQYLSAA